MCNYNYISKKTKQLLILSEALSPQLQMKYEQIRKSNENYRDISGNMNDIDVQSYHL